MDNESVILLQKVDCNCNDCVHMLRSAERFKASTESHHQWQYDYFCTIRKKLVEKAKKHKDKSYDLEMWDKIMTEADSMKFQFNRNECMINFGHCEKLNKDVSFIPNTCQIETQDCFKHRRE